MQQIEIKKHSLTQLQSGEWKITFTLLPDDMPDELVKARMGHRLYMWLIDADDYDNQNPKDAHAESIGHDYEVVEFDDNDNAVQTEGDRLRIKAVLLCKDIQFQKSLKDKLWEFGGNITEDVCKGFIYQYCDIKSRSELTHNIEAQNKFKDLLAKFESWKMEQTYKDNLERV